MKKHNGMRPIDIVILMKIIALKHKKRGWDNKSVAQSLYVSASETSESLNRSMIAGLLDESKRRIQRRNLSDFMLHGFKYVFPQKPGALQRGMPTAHSAPMFKAEFVSEQNYVWPDPAGRALGFVIEPLYPKVPQACREDETLWELLAISEMLRVGSAREVLLAKRHLVKFI